MPLDPKVYDTRSETVIVTDFDQREILIIGTLYAGEIKKSIFSVMNYLLPDIGVLPMHAGANVGPKQDVSVFFGLSGTGKTTLSTDEGRKLIGDDEHGLTSKGIFNFEGGCYAKMYKLSEATEPDIYKACQHFGSLLENVVMDPHTRKVDFFDKSIAENTRGSYPLSFIKDFEPTSQGPVPRDMFFLSADAFGILPPVARLDHHQAMYYFLSGYTAKVAGTEMGVVEPTAAFSTCFGAPFMVRKPQVYGRLLGELLEKLRIQVWLINTGWTGGGYHNGHRFPLSVTRTIIRSIQQGILQKATFERDAYFGFERPVFVEGVETKLLHPENTWKDKQAYEKEAKKLIMMFHQNMKQLGETDPYILKGAPLYRESSY
jgi:phosphoenolpyruvate carboxykinase (ATP)